MTFEERLQRLLERHEALTQSVESLHATVQEQGKTADKMLDALKLDAQNIAGLARIAESHERRIRDLERGET